MGEVPNPDQQYSLRWNDFHTSILSSFRHLREQQDFVDVTLACESGSFTAHKVVLSACSPYFGRLLKANPCQHPIVILRDVKERDMELLLRFMYNGEVNVGQEQLSDFLKTAQMLQIRGLADVPAKEKQKPQPISNSLPWQQATEMRDSFNEEDPSPPLKRSRFSPSPASSATHNNSGEPIIRESLLGQALEGGPPIPPGGTSLQNKGNSDSSLQAQSTGEDSNSSDTAMSDRGGIIGDIVPKSEPHDYNPTDESPHHHHHHHHGNGNGIGMDTQRTPPFPAALLGLQGIPGLLPGPSGLHNSNQDGNFGAVESRSYECPLCDAVVDDLHTIRAHLDLHYPRDSPTCPVVSCARGFSHPNSVRNHMRMKHAQEWDKMKTLKWSYI